MSWSIIVIIITIFQVILLLLSPRYKNRSPFSIYYRHVFQPIVQDSHRYRWKYHLVPFFYLTLFIYLTYCYYTKVEPLIASQLYFIEVWIWIPFMIFSPVIFGILTMVTIPNTVNNRRNQEKVLYRYPYDEIMYYPNIECRTCGIVKPARSKHCEICNSCILLCDHHCLWVNNCIGEGNYLYFYSFLLCNCITMTYSFIRLFLMYCQGHAPSSRNILTLLILCGSFAVICAGFTFLQLQLVKDGMTTNEQDKWFTLQEYMRDGKLIRTKDENKWFIANPNDDATITINADTIFYSTNAYDHEGYHLSSDEYTIVEDPRQITNLYDSGDFFTNLKDFCYDP
ncbi:palmitoyltransferase SWF1 NDAI_0J01000 [Naumovozyma dairenensis CBS 421]|uniref:Palmitoyltransferase n=1 Tax=Naumovozyma dairenensis (strain ATCC 10597 / BCRC 20456 / CBS 421 / NBRC 0211 / NRRL Y-12639) TaxID=1071378 RepID=G0WGR4_NAUDC|nr:hypothetical protein NDAI_0J01000 [Naumovozyma dairenensis CBS 421]CCD26992.1 hypothetical protein NDAI_0J01000 [Naumovozyma dairenensis CBS 421]